MAIELVPLAEATVTKRRWATWKPWAVVGGGAAVVGLGVVLRLSAQSQMDQYGDDLTELCGSRSCIPDEIPNWVADQESRAKLTNVFAISTIVVGSAAVIGGGALVFMNRPRAVIENPRDSGPRVQPVVSAGSVGLSLSGRF